MPVRSGPAPPRSGPLHSGNHPRASAPRASRPRSPPLAIAANRQYAVIMRKRQHAVNSGRRPAVRSPAGDAFSALVVQVLRLGGLLTAAGDALSKPAGQSSARWQVLAAADYAPM